VGARVSEEAAVEVLAVALIRFYAACGLDRTPAEIFKAAAAFAGDRARLYTAMRDKYLNQPLSPKSAKSSSDIVAALRVLHWDLFEVSSSRPTNDGGRSSSNNSHNHASSRRRGHGGGAEKGSYLSSSLPSSAARPPAPAVPDEGDNIAAHAPTSASADGAFRASAISSLPPSVDVVCVVQWAGAIFNVVDAAEDTSEYASGGGGGGAAAAAAELSMMMMQPPPLADSLVLLRLGPIRAVLRATTETVDGAETMRRTPPLGMVGGDAAGDGKSRRGKHDSQRADATAAAAAAGTGGDDDGASVAGTKVGLYARVTADHLVLFDMRGVALGCLEPHHPEGGVDETVACRPLSERMKVRRRSGRYGAHCQAGTTRLSHHCLLRFCSV
jgi:hypothetical protein